MILKINTLMIKKNIYILCSFLLFFVLSCASNEKKVAVNYHSSIFLDSEKNYSLTSGFGNTALDVKTEPSGQYVYYSRELGGNTDIFAIDTYTLKNYRLTRSPAIDSSVSVDARQDYLVFSSTRDDAYGDIYLYKLKKYGLRIPFDNLDELENNAKKLTSTKGYDINPSISRDGSLIAFISDRGGTNQLYTMRSYDGANVVKHSSLRAKNPSFSFNNKLIVFETANIGDKHSQIACVDLVTGITTVITDTPTMKFNPTFYNDDIIIYFEIEEDSDKDGEFTYADKRKLVSYSISEQKNYILDDNTTLTMFNVASASSDFAVFINQVNSTGVVAISSTKKYFIKDADVNKMYDTFSDMPYEKKLKNIDTFALYFPNSNDISTLSLAYFDLAYESYTNNSIDLFDKYISKITNDYIDTPTYSNLLNIYDVLYKNVEYTTNIYTDVRYNYLLADKLLNTTSIEKQYLSFQILEEAIKSTTVKNKDIYKSLVKLYNKSLIKNEMPLINVHLYNAPYERNDILTFSDKLLLAKEMVKSSNLVYEDIIREYKPDDIVSIAARLNLLDNLIISGNYEYAKTLFANYMNLNNTLKAIGNYANALIYLANDNDTAYASFKNALRIGGAEFSSTYEAEYSRDILNKYYRKIADDAYQKKQYSLAYENYKNVIEYNPNDSTAAYRIIESSLKSLSDIEELEKVISKREKSIIKNRYTDDNAHSELAIIYYYLSSRYYQKAITLEKSPNRYILSDKKREDGFYFYINKSFNSIIEKASFYIDFAIFLNPNNASYYIRKAEMLGFAQALKMRVLQSDKNYKSLVELLGSYNDDNQNLVKTEGYYTIAFKSVDIEAKIISSLESANILLSEGDDSGISIMLANAYLINGRYEDAKAEYEKYKKIADKRLSRKSLAWYHFFYGYSLWMGNDIKGSLGEYNKATELFYSLNDTEGLYKVIGYSAIASIEQKDYKSAALYLIEREKMIEKYKYEEDELNNLLLALCYLQTKDYNKALEYCDKSKVRIDSLDYKDFNPRYIKLSFLGSSINVVNLGLASFGGYIPGEPLNVDKKQMLYSLYQELYENLARYPESRGSLTSYKNYILEDTPKKDIKMIMLATYYNNEGYLYYKQGDRNNALKSFNQSIEEFKGSINPVEIKENPYAYFKNAGNDIKNYLSISSIYLDYLTTSTNMINKDTYTFINELKALDNALNILATNNAISPKERIILNSHLAARNYIYATHFVSTNLNTSLAEHDYNIRRLSMLKKSIDQYKYILDSKNNTVLDLKTEIIIRYNLALCYEMVGSIELASKEYVASYMKASNSSFVVEEIAILIKLMDFSRNYRYLYTENIDTEEKYARRILKLLEDSVFMIVLSGDTLILNNARGKLIEYFAPKDTKTSLDVMTLFSSIALRRSFLDNRLTPFTGRNAFALRDYYAKYEQALLSYQGYQEAVIRDYDKKKEEQYLKEIKNIEAETKKALSGTAIAPIVLASFDSLALQNIINSNETLILDSSNNLRFVIDKNKIYSTHTTNNITNTKNYITYIGTNTLSIANTNANTFLRYIRDVSEYIVPKPAIIVDKNLFSSAREFRAATSPRRRDTNTYNTNEDIANTSISYEVDNIPNRAMIKYTPISSISNLAYVPIILDLSDLNTDTITKLKAKNYYGLYVNKQTYDNNIKLINSFNTMFFVVGSSNNISKAHFINNYLSNVNKDSIENVMKGYDTNLYRIYGKTDTTMLELDNYINVFKTTMSNVYKARNITNANDLFLETLIKYSADDNEKIKYYKMFIDDYTLKNNTNITYPMSYLGFNLIKNDTSNSIYETNAYMFMKSMLNAYRRNRNEDDVISNANRILLYANKYTNTADDLIKEHFTENNLSLFLRLNKNTKDASTALDNIVSYIVDTPNVTNTTNRTRILTLSYFYHSLYAKSPSEKTEYYLNEIYTNRIITNQTVTNIRREIEGYYSYEETITNITTTINTTDLENIVKSIQARNITNENELIYTMDYLYNHQIFFMRSTINAFENTFYSFFAAKPEYVFGFLDKARLNSKDNYKLYVEKISNVFNTYNTNAMFINIKRDDNNILTAYTYTTGKTNVEKITLNNVSKFRELNTSFVNAQNERDRLNTLLNIDREFSSKLPKDSIDKSSVIFITSQSLDVMKIPFAYLDTMTNKTVLKVKDFAIDKRKQEDGSYNIKFVASETNNFYDNLQRSLVSDIKQSTNAKSNFVYYSSIVSTNISRDIKIDSFVTGITDRELLSYLFDNTATNRIIYSLKAEESGDYYKTLRLLFRNFDRHIIKSFKDMQTSYRDYSHTPYIKEADNRIYSKASYSLFDYIMPSIPSYEELKDFIYSNNADVYTSSSLTSTTKSDASSN